MRDEPTLRLAPPARPQARPPEPQPGPPGSARRPRRSLLIVAAVVLALATGGALFALNGGGGDAGGFVSACPSAGDPAACITGVAFEGEELSVEFRAQDVALGTDAVPIFFLSDVTEDGASSATRTSDWRAWGPGSPMQGTNAAGQQGWTAGEIDASQTAVCVLLGDTSGRVASGTGNCAALPASP
jgi:hypothetical protein